MAGTYCQAVAPASRRRLVHEGRYRPRRRDQRQYRQRNHRAPHRRFQAGWPL